MSRPLLLDLFCCAGGAAKGYHDAGFEVIGVDCKHQKNYPYEFHQGDALEFLGKYGKDFDAVHASPPCQDHMKVGQHPKHGTAWLLPATRDLLRTIELPWVIENVVGAPMDAHFVLCGCQFGLDVRRIRLFETNWAEFQLMPCCEHLTPVLLSVVGLGTPTAILRRWQRDFGRNPTISDYQKAMGIDWMTRAELSQAIPPAYAEWIGKHLMEVVNESRKVRV